MRICSVEGCYNKHLTRGLCNKHRLRLKRYGSLELPVKDPELRFWPKVDKSGDCWLWTASSFADGYGQFRLSTKKPVRAHRYAYELLIGKIPAGYELDHLCGEPMCVNPTHLEPVTRAQHVRRTDRRNGGKRRRG